MTGRKPTVLIVDDEEDLADLYSRWFTEEYLVRTAYNGSQALERLDNTIDVIILDRQMPDLSGDEVLNYIEEQELDCRVVMVTGVEPDFDIIDLGFDEYLTKPVTKTDLQSVVDGLLVRSEYNETLQDYFALVSKRAALEAKKSSSTLKRDDRYAELSSRIKEYKSKLDGVQSNLDSTDYHAAFRDLGNDFNGN